MSNTIRLGLASIGCLASGIATYIMLTTPLWAYYPLLFLLGWWTVMIVLIEYFTKAVQAKQWLGLAVLSGILLGIGFPPLPTVATMFIGFLPLLYIEHGIATSDIKASNKAVLKYGFIAFMTWNIIGSYWLLGASFFAGCFTFLANTLLMTIPWVLFHHSKRIFGNRIGYSSFVAYWVAFEYLHHQWELAWPWLSLGNAFAHFPSWIQWYEYTGMFGGSAWILLVNALLFLLLINNNRKPISWLGLLLLIIVPISLSIGWYSQQKDIGSKAEVVVVQPNFEPHYTKFKVSKSTTINQFIRLSKEAVGPNTSYLVYPETSFRRVNIKAPFEHTSIATLSKFLEKYENLELITGIGSYKIFEEDEQLSSTYREVISGNDTTRWDSYNAAIQMRQSLGDSIPIYIKSKLVPGAERMPYPQLFSFLKHLTLQLDGMTGSLGTQTERTVFYNQSQTEAIAPIICYESIFGEYVTDYVKKGATALFIVTNDGWWDNTAGHQQHLHYASLRAIETRRSIARSANTGISCFVNQRGDILNTTNYDEAAVIKGTIQLNKYTTFYVRYGDMIARLALYFSILIILLGFVKKRIKSPSSLVNN